jgi:hypothetical protein
MFNPVGPGDGVPRFCIHCIRKEAGEPSTIADYYPGICPSCKVNGFLTKWPYPGELPYTLQKSLSTIQ